MPKHSVRILAAAEADIEAIANYIAADKVSAALQFAADIEQKILELERFPHVGVVPKNQSLARKGYRILIVGEYLVFYCLVDKDIVEVRRVISGKRDYAFLL